MTVSSQVAATSAELIPIAVVAKLIGHSERTVYRLISAGEFPPAEYRRGLTAGRKTRLWRRSVALTWIDNSVTSAGSGTNE